MPRPSAKAQPEDLLKKLAAPTHPEFVGFAVVPIGPAMYQPCKIIFRGNTFLVEPLHDATPYEALAYEYLQGDITMHYEALQIERSRPRG